MLDPMLLAGMGEGVHKVEARLATRGPCGFDGSLVRRVGRCAVDELRAIAGEHGVDGVGHGGHQGVQEVGGDAAGGLAVQLGEGELARAIDGDEEVEPALLGAHLGDVEVDPPVPLARAGGQDPPIG
jgi:hypothetical protein